jgi:hypothetical protein
MDENIFASVVRLDEAKSFLAAEPLNCSFLHSSVLFFFLTTQIVAPKALNATVFLMDVAAR